MRALMSLVGALMRGLVVFVVMTASVSIALFIAITGPPTAEEMASMRTVADDALRDLGTAARHAGARICADLPANVRGGAACSGNQDEEHMSSKLPPASAHSPSSTQTAAGANSEDDGELRGSRPTPEAAPVVIPASAPLRHVAPHAAPRHVTARTHRRGPRQNAVAHRQRRHFAASAAHRARPHRASPGVVRALAPAAQEPHLPSAADTQPVAAPEAAHAGDEPPVEPEARDAPPADAENALPPSEDEETSPPEDDEPPSDNLDHRREKPNSDSTL